MRYNIFLRIFLHLIKLFFISININIFSNNKNIEIRQCCKCWSCKEQNNKIINNNLVKQLEAIKGDKIIVKDKTTGTILEEVITENVTTMEKYLREKFKGKDIDITHTTIYWPKEEYFKEDSISNASENEAIKKISNCPIVDNKNKNKDKNENNKTVEFETIKETSKKSIEILKNIHNEHINNNHSYLKTNNNELSFHYIRYIIQGNIVDNLKNLLFGQDEKGKCWQIEVLTNNGNRREKNEDIYPQFNDNHILKEINFPITFPNLNYQKVCAAFPAYLGDVESIKDANGFEYIDSYTKTTIDIENVSYNVYVLTNATTITNFTQVWL